MQKQLKLPLFLTAGVLFSLFLVLLVAVQTIDVAAIGPQDSEIGLSAWNAAVRDAVDTNDTWYTITELLGYAALAVAAGFAVLGAWQLLQRKRLFAIDADILLLAALYAVTLAAYLFFEVCIVNFRPVLVEGALEASFPSSHTMLTIVILGSAAYQSKLRIACTWLRRTAYALCGIVLLITIVGRLLSGVHWMTDILGGVLLAGALLVSYLALCEQVHAKK